MLTETERQALIQWYSQDHVVAEAKRIADSKVYDQLEDYLHKTCLMPLGRHEALPDYLKTAEGEPLFPTNLDPRVDMEKWQDAIEVAWEVMQDKIGLAHDDIHRAIANAQQQDWDSFIKSVEERKKARNGE